MKQLRFNELALPDKAVLIAEFGNYLESIEYYDYWIHLYNLHENFIEIFYNINTKQIDKITLASYADLDKYLSRILIKGLTSKLR